MKGEHDFSMAILISIDIGGLLLSVNSYSIVFLASCMCQIIFNFFSLSFSFSLIHAEIHLDDPTSSNRQLFSSRSVDDFLCHRIRACGDCADTHLHH